MAKKKRVWHRGKMVDMSKFSKEELRKFNLEIEEDDKKNIALDSLGDLDLSNISDEVGNEELAVTVDAVIDSNIETVPNAREISYFKNGPSRQEVADYFELNNPGIRATDLDKLFETKDEVDKLKSEIKRLEESNAFKDYEIAQLKQSKEEINIECVHATNLLKEKEKSIELLTLKVKDHDLKLTEVIDSFTDSNRVMMENLISNHSEQLESLEKQIRDSLTEHKKEVSSKNELISKLNETIDNLKENITMLEKTSSQLEVNNSDSSSYKSNLLRLKQIEALTERLLVTVSKYPDVYEEYKDTIKRSAKELRDIKV